MTKANDPLKPLLDKEGEANNESARTNESLAQRTGKVDEEAAEASIALNDPSLSRAAYTSHESGFNEDLEPKEVELPETKSGGQAKAVNG